MFCYQKNFSNPTLPVDEAQFWALVRATKWNEDIDKYRETHDAALKRKLPAFIFQAHLVEDEEDCEATLYTFRLEKVLWAVLGAYFFWMRQKEGKSMAL